MIISNDVAIEVVFFGEVIWDAVGRTPASLVWFGCKCDDETLLLVYQICFFIQTHVFDRR